MEGKAFGKYGVNEVAMPFWFKEYKPFILVKGAGDRSRGKKSL